MTLIDRYPNRRMLQRAAGRFSDRPRRKRPSIEARTGGVLAPDFEKPTVIRIENQPLSGDRRRVLPAAQRKRLRRPTGAVLQQARSVHLKRA